MNLWTCRSLQCKNETIICLCKSFIQVCNPSRYNWNISTMTIIQCHSTLMYELNWWKGNLSGSIACTRKQQPRFYWSCLLVVMNEATPLTPPSAWVELHFQMLTTYMYTPWSLRTKQMYCNGLQGYTYIYWTIFSSSFQYVLSLFLLFIRINFFMKCKTWINV